VGSIQDTASTATLCALLAARERLSEFRVNERGLSGFGVLTVYCSAEAHSSVEKNVKIAGIGRENLRKIPVDDEFGMRPDELDRAIAADVAAGRRPLLVTATVGTTGVSGFDPLREIGEICRKHGVWLHVDAAWAGNALVLPETRWMIDGVELVDSFVFNPHKWMFTNFDCSAFYVRDPQEFVRVFDILPEYLKTREGEAVTNYRDWGIQLGRRFRALKLWFVIRNYGVDGLQDLIRSHIEMAQRLADDIAAAADFELLRRPKLSLLCFRYRPDGTDEATLDELNERLLYAVNDSGKLYVTHTRMNGKYAIRFVIGQTGTESRHVDAAWRTIQETARGLA
jgi:aromatic-L-amino-acid decarboxylase